MATFDYTAQSVQGSTLTLSLDILESLENAGLTLVPDHPTQEMLAAGANAGNIDPVQAERVYSAIVNDAA